MLMVYHYLPSVQVSNRRIRHYWFLQKDTTTNILELLLVLLIWLTFKSYKFLYLEVKYCGVLLLSKGAFLHQLPIDFPLVLKFFPFIGAMFSSCLFLLPQLKHMHAIAPFLSHQLDLILEIIKQWKEVDHHVQQCQAKQWISNCILSRLSIWYEVSKAEEMVNGEQSDDFVETLHHLNALAAEDTVIHCKHQEELIDIHAKHQLGPWVDLELDNDESQYESPGKVKHKVYCHWLFGQTWSHV